MSRKNDLRLAMLIGEHIRTRRLALGITQAEVAARIPMGRENYTRVESGRHVPMLTTLVDVARALGVQLSELLEGVPVEEVMPVSVVEDHAQGSRCLACGRSP